MRGAYSIFEQIKSDYIRYYESPFALSDDGLQMERRSLLETEGHIYREPYIEVLPPFESSGRTVEQACAELGLRPQSSPPSPPAVCSRRTPRFTSINMWRSKKLEAVSTQ